VSLVSEERGSQPEDRIVALSHRAERLRGLTLLRPVNVERVQRATVRERIAKEIAAEADPDLPGSEAGLRLLGMLDDDVSLEEISSAGFADSVLGYYDPETKQLSLVETGDVEASGATILHELVHAIQDQVFDLQSGLLSGVDDDDAALAARALVEGDATEVETRFLEQTGLAGVLGEIGGGLAHISGGTGGSASGPDIPYLGRLSGFPYSAGLGFVTALRARGGQALVDTAFAHPPHTTLAVLDPDRFDTARDVAEPVTMPQPDNEMERIFATEFGAADVLAMVDDMDAALAWRGGRLVVDRALDRGTLTLRLVTDEPQATAKLLSSAIPADVTTKVSGRVVTLTASGDLPELSRR
jgi:hypothetical protein